ncbi:MAG: hypothetical protein AAGH92_08155 [Planctomycetota bacterium]
MKLLRTTVGAHYHNSDDGLPYFVDYLGFEVVHDEGPGKLHVVSRDGLCVHLATDQDYASQLAPLIRIETDDIQTLWDELSANSLHDKYVHERFVKGPELRPWNCIEFAVNDRKMCIVFQEWQA